MAHDYAKKNPSRQASVTRNKPSADASAGKPWRYFVLGVICTLLVEGLVYWRYAATSFGYLLHFGFRH